MMNAIDALSWLRRHCGSIRFEHDGTVTVSAHGRAQRAETVGDAMTVLRGEFDSCSGCAFHLRTSGVPCLSHTRDDARLARAVARGATR